MRNLIPTLGKKLRKIVAREIHVQYRYLRMKAYFPPGGTEPARVDVELESVGGKKKVIQYYPREPREG